MLDKNSTNENAAVVIGIILTWLQLQMIFPVFALFVGIFCGLVNVELMQHRNVH